MISRHALQAASVALLLLYGCSEGSREVSATVLELTPGCTLQRPGGETIKLDVNADPRSGDTIITGADGRASLALLPSSRVELGPSSTLKILALALAKDGNETADAMRKRITSLQLLVGSLTLTHRRRDVAAEPRLSIATRHGVVVSTLDCLFRVESSAGRTRIVCESGYVYFRPNESNNAARIEPGFVAEYSQNGDRSFAAADEMAAQNTMVEIATVETKLAALLRAEQQAPPPWRRTLK